MFSGPAWSSPIAMSQAIVLGSVWMAAAQWASNQQVQIRSGAFASRGRLAEGLRLGLLNPDLLV